MLIRYLSDAATESTAAPATTIDNLPTEIQEQIANAIRKTGGSQTDWINLGRTSKTFYNINKISKRPKKTRGDYSQQLAFITKRDVLIRRQAREQKRDLRNITPIPLDFSKF